MSATAAIGRAGRLSYATLRARRRLLGGRCGPDARIFGLAPIVEGNVTIGARFRCESPQFRSALTTSAQGRLEIGDGVFVNQGVTIHAASSIAIGDDAMLGDLVAIYDTNFHEVGPGRRRRHGTGRDRPERLDRPRRDRPAGRDDRRPLGDRRRRRRHRRRARLLGRGREPGAGRSRGPRPRRLQAQLTVTAIVRSTHHRRRRVPVGVRLDVQPRPRDRSLHGLRDADPRAAGDGQRLRAPRHLGHTDLSRAPPRHRAASAEAGQPVPRRRAVSRRATRRRTWRPSPTSGSSTAPDHSLVDPVAGVPPARVLGDDRDRPRRALALPLGARACGQPGGVDLDPGAARAVRPGERDLGRRPELPRLPLRELLLADLRGRAAALRAPLRPVRLVACGPGRVRPARDAAAADAPVHGRRLHRARHLPGGRPGVQGTAGLAARAVGDRDRLRARVRVARLLALAGDVGRSASRAGRSPPLPRSRPALPRSPGPLRAACRARSSCRRCREMRSLTPPWRSWASVSSASSRPGRSGSRRARSPTRSARRITSRSTGTTA